MLVVVGVRDVVRNNERVMEMPKVMSREAGLRVELFMKKQKIGLM